MTEANEPNEQNEPHEQPQLPRFERGAESNEVIFYLEDDVRVSLRGNTETRCAAQLWIADKVDTLTAPATGNILTESFRGHLVDLARERFGEGFDYVLLRRGIDQIANAFSRGSDAETREAIREFLGAHGASRTELLLKYASECEFFHNSDEEAFATLKHDGHQETWPLKSRGFKRWLRYTFYYKEKQRLGGVREPLPLRSTTISDFVAQLESKAQFEGVRRPTYIRVAERDGALYLDLCNKKWQVVEVSSEGWAVKDAADVPVRFTRFKGMAELPVPDTDGFGSVEHLRSLLNLDGDDGDRSFALICAWLMQALQAKGPYPVLVLLGGRNSAKSTAARILRSLVDPSTVPLRTIPRNPHDLYIDAVNAWVLSLDNISTLPKWLSDSLCMIATAGGLSTRTLYTDAEQELFNASRPVILNGITEVVTADDLVNRSVIVKLPTLQPGAMRTEAEMYAEVELVRPLILAGLLDAMVEGLRRYPDVVAPRKHRMADFERWAIATETALGGTAGDFIAAYDLSDEEGAHEALEASILAGPILKLATTNKGTWTGTASEMLKALRDCVDDEEILYDREWPKAPNILSSRLRRLFALFRDAGILQVEELPRESGTGVKKWKVSLMGTHQGEGE